MEGGEAGVMAVTKVFAIRVRLDDRVRYITDGEKTSLASSITYISNPEKTEQFFFTSALNCSSVDTALSEMMETKQQFGKMGGVLGYHFIQSFQPGEVTPEQAHAIGLEFAKRLFGKRYEVVISTHLNKHHLHNHLVVNSVSCIDGQKYHSSPESYYNDVRGTSDALCRENDLSVITPQGKGKHYAEWKAEQGDKPTVRGIIRADIDAIIGQAYTYDTFLMLLRKNGYEVRRSPNRKYTTVKPPGAKRAIRLDSLGEGYTEADIMARLSKQRHGGMAPPTVTHAVKHYRVKGKLATVRKKKITGFHALYLRYLYLLRGGRRKKLPPKLPFSVKREVIHLERYEQQFKYLLSSGITTEAELEHRIRVLEWDIRLLEEQRKPLYFCKPGLYSANCSYLVTDPKGELLKAAGGLLLSLGYEVRVFNLIDPEQSDCYNPFVYVREEKDVLSLIDNLIKNTTPRNASSNDPFWEKAEVALDSALMLYLIHEAPQDEQNFETMIYMMNFADVREEDEQYRSPLDMLFRALEEEQPAHVAVKQYKVFKQAAGKTAKSILVTAAVRLAAFNIPQYAAMTSMDEMDFGSLGERKRAIFCVIPVNDSSMNYLVGMLYTQCFQELYRRADLKYNGRLPVPVRVLQDEWANVAQPESYPKILATCRSYNIGLNIIVQNVQQIKALYEKEHESIIGNCDTLLFLGGGNEPASLEFIVKLLGRETLATRTRGLTKGRNGSSTTNYQQTGRDLMTIDEVRKLDTNKAILFIRGEDPVIDRKYNLKRHPNIKLTSDGKAKPYIHKPQGAPDYALPDLPYAFRSLDDYEFIDMEEPEHELSEKEKDFKPDKTE